MNMIPRHASGLSPAEQTNDFLLIAGSTPASRWERILPLFERAGCTLPAPALLNEWYAVARGNAALGQPGVATLNPGALHQSLRSASSALLDACLSPVLLAVESLEARPEFWLEELPGARLLMFHTRPEAALIAAMEAEESLNDALAQWVEAAEGLLRTFRHHRRRVALIDIECAIAAPIEFLRGCKNWLGVQPLPYSAAPTAQATVGTELQRLIAAQMVAQLPELASLVSELEACSVPIGEPATPPSVDCNGIYIKLRTDDTQRDALENERITYLQLAEERAEHIAKLEKSKTENAVLLREVQEALEIARIECRQYERDSEMLRHEYQAARAECDVLVTAEKKRKRQLFDSIRVRDEQERRISELHARIRSLIERQQADAQLIANQGMLLKSSENARYATEQKNDLLLLQLC